MVEPAQVKGASDADVIGIDRRRAIVADAMAAEKSSGGRWVPFFRCVFGVDGSVRRHLSPIQRRHYRSLPDFAELHGRIAAMRSAEGKQSESEPLQMITIRVPTALHEVLIVEAAEAELSMNKLCISKLLQSVDERFLPIESGSVRGRRPGPQLAGGYARDPAPTRSP